jgi:ribosomal protein L11 methyltransferase
MNVNMKWIEARVNYTASEGLLCADLVADLFYEMGLHGVLLDEPGLSLDPSGASDGRSADGACAVIGYIPVTAASRQRCEQLRRRLGQLEFPTRLVMRMIDDQDWGQFWKSHFKPLNVCPGLIITPSWEKISAQGDETVIEIDPGLAFGTGHHPTTVLCLQLVRAYIQTGDTLLDVGTGTGILAIAAVKSGSGRVVAIDSDETAVAVARENRRRNRIGPERMLLLCGNLAEPVRDRFKAVVANILPHVILQLIDRLDQIVEPGGLLIASGIPDDQAEAVLRKAQRRSLEMVAVKSLEGWTAFASRYAK